MAGSSKGRIRDFRSRYGGSNPLPATTFLVSPSVGCYSGLDSQQQFVRSEHTQKSIQWKYANPPLHPIF